MSSNQQFTLYTPLDMMVPNGAASTDTPNEDAAGALGYVQPGLLVDEMWYPPQHQLPGGYYNSVHTDITSYGGWGAASPHRPLYNQLPGDHPVPYPRWFDPGSTGVSPSYGSAPLPMNPVQWSAPNTCEHPYDILPIQHSAYNTYEPSHFPAPSEGGYYDASNRAFNIGLYPDLPPDKGTISGMNDAVVGVDDSVTSAPPVHLHRRGGKKREVARGPVNDCAYDGKEEPLERDKSGYTKPSAIYQRLPKLKTEALDHLVLHKDEAHGVGSDGSYICRAQGSIVCGLWQKENDICGELLRDKDCYRRHLEEQHLGLRRNINGKHAPIEDRIRRAQEEIKEYQRLKAERGGRPTKKRKRASDEECSESSPFERDEENQSKRRRGTL